MPARSVGVLELYLPYTPIERDVTAGLHRLYLALAVGLAMLYVSAFVISALVSRGLRRQLGINAFLAEHDQLTELPNRVLFHRRAQAALADASTTEETVVVGIVDLDRFKEVNDTLGHHNGDRLLREIGRRLDEQCRPTDTVARLGGDEFGIILRGGGEPEVALHRLRSSINQEFEIEGLPLSVDASVGFVVAPADGTDVDDLLQRADVAMYVAKVQHCGVARYDKAFDHYDAANLELVAELRHAIEAGDLILHYQPKVRLADGRADAVEALVRWQHPVHGLLYPDRFLHLAEQTDLIERLTEWVLDAALSEAQSWAAAGHELGVAVNVSARSLARADFSARVASVLDRHEVLNERLVIEITETALLTDPPRAAALLADLTARGVRVSIDDFGQGQTSLGYLSALALDELKIDKSFVFDMLENRSHGAIVRSIIDLGHNLGLQVVAEGVEDAEVLASLQSSGCDFAQGFLFARPMPASDLGEWLAVVNQKPWHLLLVGAQVGTGSAGEHA
jgi:diguanylate cyclase (GGDEF)-like protein